MNTGYYLGQSSYLGRNSGIWRAKWLKKTSERVRDTCLEFDVLVLSLIYYFEFEL